MDHDTMRRFAPLFPPFKLALHRTASPSRSILLLVAPTSKAKSVLFIRPPPSPSVARRVRGGISISTCISLILVSVHLAPQAEN
eukprot:scaffold243385_cov26-Tisochrysis_lutea.AAC.3